MALTRPDISQINNLASQLPPDMTFDVGQLYLMGARMDSPTSPNAGGTQVADEFDDATGIGSLGSGSVMSGYLTGLSAPTTSYTNPGSTGNRGTSVTVTNVNATGTWGNSGVPQAIVDGDQGTPVLCPNSSGGSVPGMYTKLDFGAGAAKYFTEFKRYNQNTTANSDTWKWQGSNDGTTWSDMTATWNWGGGTNPALDTVTGNYGPWRFVRMLGVSGTDVGNTNMNEVDFKLADWGYAQYTPTGSTFNFGSVNYGTAATAFDGTVTSRAYTSCFYMNGVFGVGKAFSGAQAITKVRVFSSSNGFVNGGAGAGYTLNVYGKSSSPANSTDGTILGTTTFTDAASFQVVDIACSGAAYQYVWVQSANASNNNGMCQIQYYTSSGALNITTVSNAYTALSTPSTVSFVVEYQDISTTAVVNTDIIVSASRDNGTTWSACTLTDIGPSPITGARVLKGSVSVAGQPSGTQLKWKVATANTKEQRVHGVWMQWK